MPIQLRPEVIEERVMALLCFNDEHAVQIEEELPEDYLFINPTEQTIFKKIRAFIRQLGRAPGAELDALLDAEINRDQHGLTRATVAKLAQLIPNIDAHFIRDSLQSLLRSKAIQRLCAKVMQDADTDPDAALLELERGIELVNAGVAVAEQANVYDINQGLPAEELRFIDPSFSSGIDVLDVRNCRPQRGRLWLTIGLKGQGKSARLIHFGKVALHARKKVLHFTIEMSKEEVVTKYIQGIFSLAQGDTQTVQVLRLHDHDGRECAPNTFYSLERPGINQSQGQVNRILKSPYFANRLKIVDMPANDCTTKVIELSIKTHIKQGFSPDLVIVDYIDDMRKDSRSDAMFRESMRQICVDLKSIAKKYNCAVCTATQSNREGKGSKKLTTENTSEVFAKIHAADTVETFTRTTENANRRYAILFVENTRFGKDNITVGISQCYEFGQFAIDSILHTTETDEPEGQQELERRQAAAGQRAARNNAIATDYRTLQYSTRQIAERNGCSDDTARRLLDNRDYFTEQEARQILQQLEVAANARRGRPRLN
jgi:replicative DNA helicase